MKEIYFTRHGQTMWNLENKVCGITDISLTDEGRRQAAELASQVKKGLENGDIHIDRILYSPLKRAKETALCVAEATGLPAHEEVRLKEQDFGKFEGTTRDCIEFTESKMNFADDYGNGESLLKLAQRVYNLLDELKKSHETYLLVAHNGIARSLNSYFKSESNRGYAESGIKNCELVRYEFKD